MIINKPLLGNLPDWSLFPQPAALWLFNEGTGDKVFDLSGNGNHGTLIDSPIWVLGKFGPVVYFPTTSATIDYGINAYDLGIRRNATFCGWVELDDITPAAVASLVADWNDSLGMNLRVETNGTVTFYVYPDNYRVTTIATIHAGWNFICGVMTGTKVQIYLDGIFSREANLGGDIGDSAENLRASHVGFLLGSVDNLIIFNHALSASQIAELYVNPFPWFQRDPIGLWKTAAVTPPVTTMAAHYYRHLMQGVV